MPLKEHKPTSPGRRNNVVDDYSDITKKRPEKSLLAPMVKKVGATTKAESRFGVAAAATNVGTGWSISSVHEAEQPR